MPADLTRLSEAKPEILRRVAVRLKEIGVSPAAVEPFFTAVERLDPAMRRAARAHGLRKRRDPAGVALRMFVFDDPVPRDDARAALGPWLDELLGLGLVVESPGGLVSPFILGVVEDLFVLADPLEHGDDAVIGLGGTTVKLGLAVSTRRPLRRVLDLGCGAGTLALVLARRAAAVVATDLNPRAVALTRINAALNGLGNVSVRQGDRFAPVAGESFDLIVSQPPFVARPAGSAEHTALYGGARGDELAESIVRAIPQHLARGGRAVLLVEWPGLGDEVLEDRLRAAVGPAPNLLVLRCPPTDRTVAATSYAAGLHPDLGPAFEADTVARLDHFEALGLRELHVAIVVVERSADAKASGGFTAKVPIVALGAAAVTSDRLDRLLATRTLARRGEPALLDARLRVPPGTVLTQTQIGPGADVPSTISASFPPEIGLRPLEISLEALFLLTAVHESATVREAVARAAEITGLPPDEARARVLEAVAESLEHGLLELG